MSAPVSLSSPVRSITGARALAESVALAGPDAPVGPATDRIVIFLHRLGHDALLHNSEGVLDILHLLATDRAARVTGWLARRSEDADVAAYWAQLHEFTTLELSV
jgi:hypothetical protein